MNLILKRNILGIYLSIIIAPLLLVSPFSFASASDFQIGHQLNIQEGDSIDDDLYMLAENVSVSGDVLGDLVSASENLVVNGHILGDLTSASSFVSVLGKVGDDVRIFGDTVDMLGHIGSDVIIYASKVRLLGNSIGGDVDVNAGYVTIGSQVIGDLKIYAKEVVIDAPIFGKSNIKADKVKLGPKAVISNSFSYTSPQEMTIEDGAVVNGEISFNKGKLKYEKINGIQGIINNIYSFINSFSFLVLLATFIAALFVGIKFNKYSKKISVDIADKPFLMFFRGLVFFIIFPLISIILTITVVGAPIGLIGILILLGVCIAVSFMVFVVVGSIMYSLFTKKDECKVNFGTILLGVITISILKIIPIIGTIAIIIIYLIIGGGIASSIRFFRFSGK